MIKIILIFAFLTSNIIFYSISDWYTENKLKIIKETKINFLKNSYEQILFQFDRDASIAYDIIIKNKKNIELLEKAVFYHNNKNEIELNKIREKNYDNIKKNYQYMKSIRNNESLTMAIFDIDHFKKFNDTYGHAIGDDVLKLVVDTVKKYIHGRDFLARYGGEEFIIFLPETSIKNGEIATNNLRKKISEINLSVERNITVSFGVSEYKKEESFETLFKRCDKALYNAKNNGRNRVEIA